MDHTLREVIPGPVVRDRIAGLAREIDAVYGTEPVLAVCVLKGAFVFFADLVRALTIGPEVDFVRLASYGDAMESSRDIRFSKDLDTPVEGRHVLVVEDIVDTGHSMSLLLRTLRLRNPKSPRVCALVDKTLRREVECHVDFPGFTVKEGFLVGYGMDYAEKYRNLDGIHEVVVETDRAVAPPER